MSDPAYRSHEAALRERKLEVIARVLGRGGWRDEDGVWHSGVTVRDWSKAAEVLDALAAAGLGDQGQWTEEENAAMERALLHELDEDDAMTAIQVLRPWLRPREVRRG